MIKRMTIINLDCANCARKMEDEIKKIDGIKSVNISFMTQKITLDIEESKEKEVLEQAASIVKKVNRACKLG